jgi:hypothetical protein
MKKIFTIVFVLILSTLPVLAQPSLPCKNNSDVLLVKDKPSAYITFERVSQRKPKNKSESGEVIWLKLHNNSAWAIYLNTYSLHTDSEYTEIQTCRGKIESLRQGVDVEPLYIAEHTRTGEKIFALEGFTLTGSTWLASGQTLLFAVPREHLVNEVTVYISFSYEWEWKWKGEKPDAEIDYKNIGHQVYFYAYEIPKGVEKQKQP